MNSTDRLIGVAVPTYNRLSMLVKLLSTIPDAYEVYVSDNGGFTDPSKFEGRLNTNIDKTNTVVPIFSNWNRAMSGINSPYVVIPSDDDLFLDNAFTEIELEIDKNPEVEIFIFGHNNIDEKDTVLTSWVPDKYQKFDPPFGFNVFKFGVEARMPSIVFKKSLLDRIGYFDDSFKLTAGDSDLVQRTLIYAKCLFVPKIIACYRIWGGASTTQTIASEAWLNEIGLWTHKIATTAELEFLKVNSKFDKKQFIDEIYARNLMSGAENKMKSEGGKSARHFIFSHRFPYYSSAITKLNLLKQMIRTFKNW